MFDLFCEAYLVIMVFDKIIIIKKKKTQNKKKKIRWI